MDYPAIICEVTGQECVYYKQFGDYQGQWVMVTRLNGTYYIYKDWYGSCCGCDSLEAFCANYDWNADIPMDDKRKFVEEYKPFSELPEATFKDMLALGTLRQAMPANIRLGLEDDYVDIPEEEAWAIITDGIRKAIEAKETDNGRHE